VQLLKEDGLHSDPAEERCRHQERDYPLQGLFTVKFLQQQGKLLLLVLSLRLGIISQ